MPVEIIDVIQGVILIFLAAEVDRAQDLPPEACRRRNRRDANIHPHVW